MRSAPQDRVAVGSSTERPGGCSAEVISMGTHRVVARFHCMEEAGGFDSPQLHWCITHQLADAYREAFLVKEGTQV